MRPYEKINVEMSYQSFGKTMLVILRGEEKDIELVYNGIYNFGGCANKEVDYTTHTRDVACFFSTRENMHKFFFNKAFHKHVDNWPKKKHGEKSRGIWPFCMEQADKDMTELEKSQVTFYDPTSVSKYAHLYSLGDRVSAERPDDNFEDSILKSVFFCENSDIKISQEDVRRIEETNYATSNGSFGEILL